MRLRTARGDLASGLPSSQAQAVGRAQLESSAASGHGQRLRSDVFVLSSAGMASHVLQTWRRVHRAKRISLGRDGSEAVSHGVALVAWREGARVGVVRLSAGHGVDAGANALAFARLGDRQLTAPAPTTAWGRLTQQIRSDGSVSEQTALQAFVLTYGPLPGVRTPAGARQRLLSGVTAAAWALRYRSRLSRRLREAIDRKLGLTSVGTAHVAKFGDSHFHQDASLTKDANKWAAVYADAAHLSHPLGLTIVAGTTTSSLDEADMDSMPVDASGKLEFNGPYCRIRSTTSVAKGSISYREFALAHEVFHCFQFDLDHNWEQLPDWIMEGMATWASLSVIPAAYDTPRTEDYLIAYLQTPDTELSKRSYDGVGVFGHAMDSGTNVWKVAPAIVNPSFVTEEGRFVTVGGENNAFLDSWGSSFFRLSLGGTPWQIHSPVVPPSNIKWPLHKLTGNEVVDAPAYATRQYKLQAVGGEPLVHVNIHGHARLSATYNYIDVENSWFCMTSECVCPPHTVGVIPPNRPLLPGSALGLSSNPKPTAGTVFYYSLADFCHTPPTPPGPGPGGGGGGGSSGGGGGSLECFVDCGSSAGDPHVTTFSGVDYDFQAAGEFTLVKSPSRDLDVQVRQQPYPGSRDVAINTAAAMRVGHATVEVDAINGSSKGILFINRRQVSSGSRVTRKLGGGASLVKRGGVVTVTWSDRSKAQVTLGPAFGCRHGLMVAVKVARHRFKHVSGLLGDAGVAQGSDLVGGNGHRYGLTSIESPYTPHAFDVLYHQFGRSWQVNSRDSLFTYSSGKSSRSYDNNSFPSKAATLGMLTPREFAAAQRECGAKGVTNSALLANCIFDVSITSDPCFGFAARQLQESIGGPPPGNGGVSPIGWKQLSAHPDGDPLFTPSLAAAGTHLLASYPASGDTAIETASFAASSTGVSAVSQSDPFTGWRDIGGGPLLFPAPGGGLQMIFSGDHTAAARDPLNGTEIAPIEINGSVGAPVNAGVSPYPSTGVRPNVDLGAVLAAGGQTPVWTATSGFSLQLERGAQNAASSDLSGLVANQVPHGVTLAHDSSGRLWLAWYAQTHDPSTNGQWLLQLDPTGAGPAPGATPQHAPSSGINFGNIDNPALVCTQLCRLVYEDSSGDRVDQWTPGQRSPTMLATDPGQVSEPTAAYTANGRLWVTWVEVSTGRVLAQLAGGQPIILQKPNEYGTPLYSTSLTYGNLLVLVTNWENGVAGTGTGQTAVWATVVAGGS